MTSLFIKFRLNIVVIECVIQSFVYILSLLLVLFDLAFFTFLLLFGLELPFFTFGSSDCLLFFESPRLPFVLECPIDYVK